MFHPSHLQSTNRQVEEKQALESQLSKALRMYQEQLRSTVRMATVLHQGPSNEADAAGMEPQRSQDVSVMQPTEEQVLEYARYALS